MRATQRLSLAGLTVLVSCLALAPAAQGAGELDTTFDGDGKVLTDFSNSDDQSYATAVQSDGKVVAVGYTSAGDGDFALTRYNANGSLDTGFDSDGRAVTDFGSPTEAAYGVAIQPDGKIVVAGGSAGDFALARYNTDGSLDTGFDSDGKVLTDFGSFEGAPGIALPPDGKIVVAGSSGGDVALARYNTDGSLDTGFDSDGKVLTDFAGGNDFGAAVAIQPDGKIVVAGGSGGDFALARYNTDGSLDTGFDSDGRVVTDFSGSDDSSRGVALQADGKVVASGFENSAGDYNFALARYNTDGSLDTGFDSDGKVVTDFGGSGDDVGGGVAIQNDGKVVVAGYSAPGGQNFALARYNVDGSLDTGFDSDGKVVTDFANSNDVAYALAIQGDGKIVVAGHSRPTFSDPSDFALARYYPAGPPADPEPPADLQITKSASPEPAEFGVLVTYTVSVRNNGPGTARSVRVRDDLPANVQYDSASGASCTGTGPVTCDLGDLPANQTRTLTIQVTPVATGTATNTATVSSSTPDPNSGNDRATATSTITAPLGLCTITGTAGNETLVGTAGNDVICGLGGVDYLYGSGGDDVLLPGGGGYNFSFGDGGRDTIQGGSNDDYYYGGPGDDRLLGGPSGRHTVRYHYAPGPVLVDLVSGVATGEGTDSLSRITAVSGSRYGDMLIGNDAPNALYGYGGPDNITGAGSRDDLRGEDGDDWLNAGPGPDLLEGGPDQDVLEGGADFDGVWHPTAQSSVTVSLAAGSASGGAGNDVISAIEAIDGSAYDDILTGDDLNNTIHGRGGADTIVGRGGRDGLFGDDADDELLARDGAGDQLNGGAGSDGAEVDPFGLDSSIGVELFLP